MSLRSRSSATIESSPREKALGVVDTALAFATRRRLFTRDEAIDLLRGVRNQVGDAEIESTVDAAIAAAGGFGTGDVFVDRNRVVDLLLDLRLAVNA
jgi:hypothetical protein